MGNGGLVRWLHRNLPYRRMEWAQVPLSVATTDLCSGEPVYFDSGPVLPPLVASCAIPGMFPPVRLGGKWLVDGGPAAFMPVSRAVELGADRVFVLPCGGTEPFRAVDGDNAGSIATWPAPETPPRSVSGVNGAALGAGMIATARLELQQGAQLAELYVVPAPTVLGLSPYTFDHAGALINASWEIARRWYPHATPVPPQPVDLTGTPLAAGRFDAADEAAQRVD